MGRSKQWGTRKEGGSEEKTRSAAQNKEFDMTSCTRAASGQLLDSFRTWAASGQLLDSF
jgi:hypothetical protein